MKTTAYPLSSHGAAILIPTELAIGFQEKGIKRIICNFQNGMKLHGQINRKEDFYYLMMGKQTAKNFGVLPGDVLDVEFIEDQTKYQMAVSDEFEEVLSTDYEGEKLFHKLTPGKQRSILHSINKIKSSDLRISKSLRLMKNLNTGETDIKKLLR